MPGNWRHSALFVLTLLGASVFGSANPGYLPVVGPAPVRFRAVFAPATNFAVLPPPVIAESEPVLVKPDTLNPLNTTTNVQPPAAEEAPPANALPYSPMENSAPGEVISPQMLLKYFTKNTNHSGASLIGPMNFTPPQPTQPASSTATYSTSP